MPKANQKFTHTARPSGKITTNIIGKGKYDHPDALNMNQGSLQYEQQMKRHLNGKHT